MKGKNTPDESQTFEQKVNSVVEKLTVDDKGAYQVPEGETIDEAVLFSAKAEKRRRDTQSAYTKSQQKLKELEGLNGELLTRYEKLAITALTPEQADTLENLKLTDPEAWRAELNKLEEQARKRVKEEVDGVKTRVGKESEIERRTRILEEYNAANPKVQLNDEVIENDIPPRFVKQLEKGEVTFEEFIDKCNKYLTGDKVIKKPDDPKTGKTLDDVGGRSTPADDDVNASIKKTYTNETY